MNPSAGSSQQSAVSAAAVAPLGAGQQADLLQLKRANMAAAAAVAASSSMLFASNKASHATAGSTARRVDTPPHPATAQQPMPPPQQPHQSAALQAAQSAHRPKQQTVSGNGHAAPAASSSPPMHAASPSLAVKSAGVASALPHSSSHNSSMNAAAAAAASPRLSYSPAISTPSIMMRNESQSSMLSLGSSNSPASRASTGLHTPTSMHLQHQQAYAVPATAGAASAAAAASASVSVSASRSVEPPNRSHLATLFAAHMEPQALLQLLAAAQSQSSLPSGAAAELLHVGLEPSEGGVEASVDALDAWLRPPTRFAKTAPPLMVDRSEYWYEAAC